MPNHSIEDIRNTVDQFESATIQLSAFRHEAHLMVAISYLKTMPFNEALSRIRACLGKILERNGIEGYNETVTVFWMKYTVDFLKTSPEGASQAELTNLFLSQCPGPGLINKFYSRELLSTAEARQKWVKPDLQPLTWD